MVNCPHTAEAKWWASEVLRQMFVRFQPRNVSFCDRKINIQTICL